MTHVLGHKSVDGRGGRKDSNLPARVDLFENPEKGKDGAVEGDTAEEAFFGGAVAEHSF